MKKILALTVIIFACSIINAQNISQPPSGGNQKASVTQWIGPVSITINYNSPDVHGPNGEDRKGHIWGELVKYGFTDQGFGSAKAAPWRAGANENTTITFSDNVTIEGKEIVAGTYGVFIAVEKDSLWTWILSKNHTSWGSFFYDPKEDALRVEAKPEEAPYTEWLTYGFDNRNTTSATAYLQWENKRVSFKIDAPNVNELYVSRIRQELRSSPGFDYRNYVTAAQFCVQNKIHLEEALVWADEAISLPFIGQENFITLQTKSMVLDAMGKNADANAVMDKAITLPSADIMSIHQYGKTLIANGKSQKAFEVFTLNRKLHPADKFTTFVGMARGYTALGDKKNAIKNWEVALKNIPDDQKRNLEFYEGELKKLKS